jgi:hypothetical protein
MAITGTAELGDTIPTIIARAHFQEDFDAVMRGICWNYAADKGTTTNIPYWARLTANQLTEKIDMVASETIEDTNVQVSPVEVGLKTILTYNAIEDDNEDMKSVAGKLMGSAYEKKRDEDLLGQLDDASSSLCGSANTMTMGHIAASRATLLGNTAAGGKAPLPYVAVIHPNHELDLVDVITPVVPAAGTTNVTGTPLTDDVLRNYSIGRLFGIPIVVDGNIALTASAAKGGVFSAGEGGGIIYVEKRAAEVMPDDDPSMRGIELNYVGRYGVGEFFAAWIVELFADATAPA